MTSFSESILQVSKVAFDKCSGFTNLFVLPLFLGKVAYSNASGGSSDEYKQLLRGVVLYFILIFTFEPILQLLLNIPETFLPKFSLSAASEIRPDSQGRAQAISMMPSVLMWTLESVVACLYYIAMFLNFAFAVLLASLAPVIFLMCTILGIGFGVRTFFSLLVVVSTWPIVWAAANELHKLVLPLTDGDLQKVIFEIAITVLKICAPLAIAYFGMSSSPGQSLSTAVTTSIATGSVAAGLARGAAKKALQKPNAHEHSAGRPGNSGRQSNARHTTGLRSRSTSKGEWKSLVRDDASYREKASKLSTPKARSESEDFWDNWRPDR